MPPKPKLKLDLSGIKIPTIDELIEQECGRALTILEDFIELRGISCIDANGKEFEKYDKLYVRTDVEKTPNESILKLTHYNHVHHCEQQGNFSPSSALMANIYVTLYHAAVEKQADGTYRTKDAVLEAALQKLKDRGDGYGGNWVNTLVDWQRQQIIHYPQDGDFPSNEDTAGTNASRRRVSLPFDRRGFTDKTLADALSLPNYKKFLQNYTGLPEPAVLIDAAEYFGRTVSVWVSSSNETKAAWLGCGSINFNLYGNSDLDNGNAARGVRRG